MTAVCNQTLRHHHASGQLCSLPCAGSSFCSFSILFWFCFTWLSVPNFSAANLAKRNCGERDNPRTATRRGGEQKNPERTELRMRSTVAYTVFPVLCTLLRHVVELEAACSWRLEEAPCVNRIFPSPAPSCFVHRQIPGSATKSQRRRKSKRNRPLRRIRKHDRTEDSEMQCNVWAMPCAPP